MADAICVRLEANGFDVVRLVENDQSATSGVTVDFADDQDIVRATAGLSGAFDAIAVSHAFAETGDLGRTTPAQFRRVIDLNLTSIYVLLHTLVDRLAPGASIVVVSSTAGLDRSKNSAPSYTASKAGVNGLVRHLTPELAAREIRINAVCAGLIDDELAASVNTETSFAEAVAGIPLGRPGQPTDIADAVQFLLSDDASYMTGALLSVAGGTHR